MIEKVVSFDSGLTNARMLTERPHARMPSKVPDGTLDVAKALLGR